MDTGDQKLSTESQDSGGPASVGTSSRIFSFDKVKCNLMIYNELEKTKYKLHGKYTPKKKKKKTNPM